MKTLQSSFGAGERKEWMLPGTQFRLIVCNDPVTVTLYQDGAPLSERMEGVTFGTWTEPAGGFERVAIESATAQTIKFAVSSRRSGVDAAFGSVSVLNPEPAHARTLANAAYLGGYVLAKVAAQYAHVGLYNDTAASKLVVTRAKFWSDGTSVRVARAGAQLANATGTRDAKKLGGLSASVGLLTYESNASPLMTPIADLKTFAGVYTEFDLYEPVVIEPGLVFGARANAVNTDLAAWFEYYTVPHP